VVSTLSVVIVSDRRIAHLNSGGNPRGLSSLAGSRFRDAVAFS
jgi:hypothetical protein